MFKNLLSGGRTPQTLDRVTADFNDVVGVAAGAAVGAHQAFWQLEWNDLRAEDFEKSCGRAQELAKRIRTDVLEYLGTGGHSGLTYCLSVFSMIKDADRLAAYSRSLATVPQLSGAPQTSPAAAALKETATITVVMADACPGVLRTLDTERAAQLLRDGREAYQRYDRMLGQIAVEETEARPAMTLTLGSRYYRAMTGHLLNLFQGLVVPVEELDTIVDESERRTHLPPSG